MALHNISTLSLFMQIHTHEITQLHIFNKPWQINIFILFFFVKNQRNTKAKTLMYVNKTLEKARIEEQ